MLSDSSAELLKAREEEGSRGMVLHKRIRIRLATNVVCSDDCISLEEASQSEVPERV